MLELPIIKPSENCIWPKGWKQRTTVMGIINITPDSFSDGGRFLTSGMVVREAASQLKQGADVIDLGAQSTRPGAEFVAPELELKRLLPALIAIRERFPNALISVDTFNSHVAFKAIEAGADWINDISSGRHDNQILNVVAEAKCPFVLTHSRGNSKNMNSLSIYNDLIKDIDGELMQSIDKALEAGIDMKNLIIDPGIGFAKNTEQNLIILNNLQHFSYNKYPILVGPSRKRFIVDILGEENDENRLYGTLAVICKCVESKVSMVRVHDVSAVSKLLQISNRLW